MTTDTKYNKFFILDCIERSVKKLNNKPEFKEIEFIIQEGITGESGSVKVASKIVDDRIPNCDIFIADLSVVNHISKGVRVIRKILRDKYKPYQNNNVIYEYGVAYEAIGEHKIISILNKSFGSPNENPSNIPFDLSHLRFPIEYEYSKKADNKQKAQTDLIGDLTRAIKESAVYALQNQKEKYKPFIVWKEWENSIAPLQKYHSNEKIVEITRLLKVGTQNPKQSTRLIGLSGLGKTRIVLESFRSQDLDHISILLNSRVLYLNYNYYQNADYQAIFSKLTQENEDRIVILDNCPQSLHRNLLHFINNENNIVSLITIDSNPEEIEHDKTLDVNYLVIRKEDFASIVDDILTEDFSILEKDNIEKIKEFSQGIPLMAVLIGNSIKNGEKFIGKLDDKELLDKLLGSKGQNDRSRTILKSCSVFNYFGIKDELRSQIEFIASNKDITSLTGENEVIINEFDETCTHYLKREIFERKGRLLGMRPFPLAMYLAQEWLEPCTPERLIRVITSISNLPDPDRKSLAEALAEQMKYLGYNDKAVSIIEKIVGPNSPFDNAEVINTELGSRLFRSFVEVNPIAVSKNFVRLFSTKSKDELKNIIEGRRNIIWVLEKLCFDIRTFSESVKIMYAFAVAENESWSNNATGQFLHLFNIILSGTEANLHDRWQNIEWGLVQSEPEYTDLAIKAMRSGLNYGHFSRDGGSEKQGSKILHDYYPNWQEIAEYWTNILSKLTEIVKSKNHHADDAGNIIANCVRSVCNARLAHVILPFIEDIATFKNNNWDEALKGLKYAKKFEKGILTGEQLDRINSLIEILTKSDFNTRFSNISTSYYLDNEESYSSEKVIEAIVKLAEEFINTNIPWDINIPFFYKNQQIYTYHFGKRLYELLKEDDEKIQKFIKLSLDSILSIKKAERNVNVLGGFIAESDDSLKVKFYSDLSHNGEISYLLFYFIALDISGKKHFNILFDLVDHQKCNITEFSAFSYGKSLSRLNGEELMDFSEKMFTYGDDGYTIIFDLLFSLGYNDTEKQKSTYPILRECILKLGFSNSGRRQVDGYKWAQIICSILEIDGEKEFAIFINRSIINSITINNLYHLDHDIQRIYESLMKNHFSTIWGDLSEALISKDEEYIKYYGLKHILGSHIGGVGRSIGVLFDGDINAIFEWCRKNSPLAPVRLAELVPIFGEQNSKYSIWHPITKRLIDEFGDIDEVLKNLGANMGTYSWTGSTVPFLEAKKELFSKIVDHKIKAVSDWAIKYLTYLEIEINHEKNNDEEMYL